MFKHVLKACFSWTFRNLVLHKMKKRKLAYFSDIDYSKEVDYLAGFEVSEDGVKSLLTSVVIFPF